MKACGVMLGLYGCFGNEWMYVLLWRREKIISLVTFLRWKLWMVHTVQGNVECGALGHISSLIFFILRTLRRVIIIIYRISYFSLCNATHVAYNGLLVDPFRQSVSQSLSKHAWPRSLTLGLRFFSWCLKKNLDNNYSRAKCKPCHNLSTHTHHQRRHGFIYSFRKHLSTSSSLRVHWEQTGKCCSFGLVDLYFNLLYCP